MREANFQAFSGDESACEDDTDITVLRRTTEETAQWCVERAKALGASSASAEASFDRGLSASTRMCEPESIERTEESVLVVNVWKGAQRGTASTSDLSEASLERTVRAAVQIASHAKPDPAGGLPDEADLATEFPDLSLYHPFAGTPEEAFRLLERTEAAALVADARITNTEGARFDTSAGVFTLANSLGFCAGYAYGRHSIDCWPIAQSPEGESQRDGWWCEARALEDLMSPEALGALAAQRAVRRLDAGAVSPGRYNVLFEPQAAVGYSIFSKRSFPVRLSTERRRASATSSASEFCPSMFRWKKIPSSPAQSDPAPLTTRAVPAAGASSSIRGASKAASFRATARESLAFERRATPAALTT